MQTLAISRSARHFSEACLGGAGEVVLVKRLAVVVNGKRCCFCLCFFGVVVTVGFCKGLFKMASTYM